MIIECGHCGAPLDVKGDERSTKCRYCGTPNQVKSTRTIAFETPRDWRPPPQWTPPAHAAANSTQVLTYRAASSSAALFIVIAVVTVLAVGGGIVASVVSSVSTSIGHASNVERQVDKATKDANQAIAQALARASAAQEQAHEALGKLPGAGGDTKLNLLTNAGVRQVIDVYKETLGTSELTAKELTLHDSHSSAEFQSPKNPQHVDGYRYLMGRIQGPEPVRLIGREKTGLKSMLFNPEKTALMDLEKLGRAALGKLAYEQARITHVIAERDRGKIQIRVYGSSPRDSGYVAFDEKGKVTRVAR